MSTRTGARKSAHRAQEPYVVGYADATRACITRSVESAWSDLMNPQHRGPGYLTGYRAGVRDFEQGRGLSPSTPPPAAYGNGLMPPRAHPERRIS